MSECSRCRGVITDHWTESHFACSGEISLRKCSCIDDALNIKMNNLEHHTAFTKTGYQEVQIEWSPDKNYALCWSCNRELIQLIGGFFETNYTKEDWGKGRPSQYLKEPQELKLTPTKHTSYEISKRLDELSFHCESHCGWWGTKPEDESLCRWGINDVRLAHYHANRVKAYDCWDLLMWVVKNFKGLELLTPDPDSNFNISTLAGVSRGDQPQNALGRATIKILEDARDLESGSGI